MCQRFVIAAALFIFVMARVSAGSPACQPPPCPGTAACGDAARGFTPHACWGVLTCLQDPFVITTFNDFFREKGHLLGFPEQLTVKPHVNGYSLTYEWTDSDGVLMQVHQTARPSLWFTAVSANGALLDAQERKWGFVTTFRPFRRKPVHQRAEYNAA